MNKVNLGIVGAGKHLRSHLGGFGELPVKVTAIVDPGIKNIEDLIDERNKSTQASIRKLVKDAIIYGSEEEMYSSGTVDAIISGTPDVLHFSNFKKAVNYGVHAMIEKPLTMDLEGNSDLAKYLKLAEEKNLVLSSCHIRRFDPPFLWLKEHLPELTRKMGKVLNVNYDFSYTKIGDGGLHVGLLMDHFNHEIDLLNFLLGYENVQATKFYDSEERYSAGGIRNDGVAFNFNGTRLLDIEGKYPEFVEVRFERGDLKLSTKDGAVCIRNHETGKEEIIEGEKVDYIRRLAGVNKNFINTVLGLEENYLTPREMFMNTSSGLELTYRGSYDSLKDENLEKLQKVAEGEFGDGKWELIKTNVLPDREKVTGVFSVIYDESGKIFLTKNNEEKPERDWDLPGGHVDEGETVEEAGPRELEEEAGIKEVKNYGLVGYIKITTPNTVKREGGNEYPNPGYMAYYVGENDGDIGEVTGEEIEKSETFTKAEAMNILASEMDKAILEFLL